MDGEGGGMEGEDVLKDEEDNEIGGEVFRTGEEDGGRGLSSSLPTMLLVDFFLAALRNWRS